MVANSLAKISIIIPHFNRGDLLQETLESVRDQSFVNWEVIVVDDGSMPEEWQKAQQFRDQRVRFVQRTDGIKGPSRCRNIGLQCSTGEYVVFVDSDDLLAPWCLADRVQSIESHTDVGFVVFPVMLFRNEPGDLATLWNRLEGDNDLDRFLRSDPPWHTSSPLWRREAIEKLGGFDEAIMYGDDADLHMRALFARVQYANLGGVVPDAFIRRAADGRITNTLTDRLLESRVIRLGRGTQLVKSCGTSGQQRLWEGQYFVEAEFLLFNVPNSRQRQQDIIRSWRQSWAPTWIQTRVVCGYFWLAHLTRHRCYTLLRVARRLAISMLPCEFFPRGGSFETAELSAEEFRLLVSRLAMRQV